MPYLLVMVNVTDNRQTAQTGFYFANNFDKFSKPLFL